MTVRCAIYTRKSTEEGLERDFNSLDAQREACEAFVKSQKGLGWTVLRKHYDDGGVSGGTMDRPALQELLTDIEVGKVDLVVVYKVDRLTRSLMDFARIIETFEAKEVSFVSVTQQFNTANSMGRLTLNVLLSFAQFEREVTAERIRDKIAASKKKGMWMGGPTPLGYDVDDRKLTVNESEVQTVRQIFRLYVELGTVRRAKEELDRLGIFTKRRVQKNGKQTGGKPFSRGNLYQLLSNPIYIGRIPHKGETYPGEHDAIVDQHIWETVQNLMAGNATTRTQSANAKGAFLLTGKIHDESGDPLYQSQAHKGRKRYCYYISSHLMHGADVNNEGWRVPAKTMEDAVIAPLLAMLRNQSQLIDHLHLRTAAVPALNKLKTEAAKVAHQLEEGEPDDKRNILQAVVQRVDLRPDLILLTLDRCALAEALGMPQPNDVEPVSIHVPVRLRRRGVETKLIINDPNTESQNLDDGLCRLIAQAHGWFDQLATGEASTVREIAKSEGINEHEITRVLHLAFLSPRIVEDILNGKQADNVSVYRLRRLCSIPFDWHEQAELLENLR